MELIKDILIIIIPSAAVFLTAYFLFQSTLKSFRTFIESEEKKKLVDLKVLNVEKTMPLRLQAYERLTLFLERIAFENLIPRTPLKEFTAFEYQTLLIQTIRQEFEHNLSQQLYVSNEVWELIKNAKEDTISIINSSAAMVKQDAPARELSSAIFENSLKITRSARQQALDVLKKEIKSMF
jgi:hypothetical protein